MSSSLGHPLLPITGAFALPFAGYYIFLSLRVGLRRVTQKVAIGDRTPQDSASSPSPSSKPGSSSSTTTTTTTTTAKGIHTSNDPLLLATRAHQNFGEFVPFALLLSAVAELNGGDPKTLKTTLSVLLAARVLHAEFGIMSRDGLGVGRPLGFYSTVAVMAWLAGWGAWLASPGL
ncbi:membrane-associated, eicosanoid/glutathione metabolism protein [Hypoxylon sp. FL1857]|nr:membrane-associated, eicosanoid/glutathione metabolism protein [Hypoxylon sp. FL1857]